MSIVLGGHIHRGIGHRRGNNADTNLRNSVSLIRTKIDTSTPLEMTIVDHRRRRARIDAAAADGRRRHPLDNGRRNHPSVSTRLDGGANDQETDIKIP